jgi:hypothetical protein
MSLLLRHRLEAHVGSSCCSFRRVVGVAGIGGSAAHVVPHGDFILDAHANKQYITSTSVEVLALTRPHNKITDGYAR